MEPIITEIEVGLHRSAINQPLFKILVSAEWIPTEYEVNIYERYRYP